MKRKMSKKLIFAFSLVLALAAIFAVFTYASEDVDAMIAIEADEELMSHLVHTKTLETDGYIGIPVELSVFYDTKNGTRTATPDFMVNGGTPVVMYVVNTKTERVGTDSDVDIIKSMLERDFIVVVLDYMNDQKTKPSDIDWSVQEIRRYIGVGNHISEASCIPNGSYKENFVVPAGCNISVNHVFWEADKHGADGTIDKMVEMWNNDFRATTGEVIIPWVREDGTRKTVTNAIDNDHPLHDGSAPVWYMDASGTLETEEGKGTYTKVKYTWAESVFDLVDPDGKPIDLNLYMHIIYPTNPEKSVPVTALASSSTYCTTAKTGADMRAHSNGFLFRGYANVVFDYLWIPMARMASYDYFDGRASDGALTGDQLTYSLHVYNDKRINTAAMRYLRYIANEYSDIYDFDTEKIGVYGNSKGGWFTFVGSAELHEKTTILNNMTLEESIDARINGYTSKRDFVNHVGETRYQNGDTVTVAENGVTIDGGELQPWLTYKSGEKTGEEIPSYATVLYPCCAPAYEDIEDGHAPMFLSSNIYDEYHSAYNSSNIRTNIARMKNVPSLTLETAVGHMLTYGDDLNYGVDSYDAFFDFFGYYLKDERVKVVYVTPLNKAAGVDEEDEIVIQFIGSVSETEIDKISITDENGNELLGEWSAFYGDTQWTFTPEAMLGSTTYTVSIPADLKGDNGTTLGEAYETKFTTEYGRVYMASLNGNVVSATVPQFTDNNGFALRFYVSNDAANIANIYGIDSPDAEEGAYIGSVNLIGRGYYELDVTDYLISKTAGDMAYFLIEAAKTAGTSELKDDFNAVTASNGYTASTSYKTRFAAYVRDPDSIYPTRGDKFKAQTFDGASTVKYVMGTTGYVYENIPGYDPAYNEFYLRLSTALFNDTLINGGNKFTESDYGRKFTVKLRLYDTTSRDVLFYVESMTGYFIDNYKYETMDYTQPINNFNTKANEWVELTLEYTVRDTDFGVASEYEPRRILLEISPEGYIDENGNRVDYPMYIDYLSVTETVTDIEISEASVIATNDGGKSAKAPLGDSLLALYDGDNLVGGYATFKAAMAAYKEGYTVKLNSNITVTDTTVPDNLGKFERVIIDLNGYKMTADTKQNAPFTLSADNLDAKETFLTVKNGSVSFGDTSLIGYGKSNSEGAGKIFNVKFNDVFISLTGRTAYALNLMSETALPEGASVNSNIALEDCVISIDNDKLSRIIGCLFPTGEENLKLSYEMQGGEIRLDSERWLNINDAVKTLSFTKDASGEYTKLVLPASENAKASNAYMSDMGIASYTKLEESGSYNVFTLEVGELSTKYGMIPEEYASVSAYPFVIFNADGECVGAKSTFQSVLDDFKNTQGADWYVVLRTDYTYSTKYDNLGQGRGKLHFDLGGHTITLSGVMLYNADAKKDGDIEVHTSNGTVLVDSVGMVRILGWDTTSYDIATVKNFDFYFNDITVKLQGSSTSLATYYHNRASSAQPGPSNNKVVFTDCVFDITGASSTVTIFEVGGANGGQRLAGDFDIIGGKIIADSSEMLNICKVDYTTGSSFTLVKNADGNYPTVTLSATSAAPGGSYETSEGYMVYQQSSTDGEKAEFTLVKNTLTTPYGDIDPTYASIDDYPFVVFSKAGKFIGGYGEWGIDGKDSALNAAKNTGDGAVIYLRRDFTYTAKQYNNLNQQKGTLYIDLGGHTLTDGSTHNYALFYCSKKQSADTSVVVKNGDIELTKNPLVRPYANTSALATTQFNLTFENVNVKLAATNTVTSVIISDISTASTGASIMNVTFNDCKIDLTNLASGGVLANANLTKFIGTVNIKINGGEIIGGSSSFVFGNVNSSSSITYGEGSDGYTKLKLPENVAAPSEVISALVGKEIKEMVFVPFSVTNGIKTAALTTVDCLNTPYGKITPNIANSNLYPFVVFKKDSSSATGYTFYDAYEILCKSSNSSAFMAAVDLSKKSGLDSLILMRRDYTRTLQECAILGQCKNEIVIDLGGYTLTDGYSKNIGILYASRKTANSTTMVMRNGTVALGRNALINYYSTNSAEFNVILENLTIKLAEGAATKNIIAAPISSATTVRFPLNVTVKNCVIDVRGAANTVTLFNANDTSSVCDGLVITIEVENSEILADSTSKIKLTSVRANGSSVTFLKSENGNYVSVTLPKGSDAPSGEYDITGGKAVFVKVSENESTVTYRLRNAKTVDIDFTPKTSITLGNELSINVYIPVESVQKFTFNGVTYENLEAIADKKVTVDGKDYYRMTVALGSAEAAKDIKLVATVTAGEATAVATFTFSIPKYAAKVLANGTDVEKTLAKDVLAYVKAAYNYFTEFNTAEEIARVNALIDSIIGDYKAEPVSSGETNKVSPVTSVTLNLDSKPSIRFYVTDTNVEFYANGRKLDTVTGTDETYGAYVELDVYAYALSETITYGNGGSYHISSFVNGAVGTSHESLVKAFVKYVESAADYREAYLTANPEA